jgi:hypothetical protein
LPNALDLLSRVDASSVLDISKSQLAGLRGTGVAPVAAD